MIEEKSFTVTSDLQHSMKETISISLTGNPDVVQLSGVLHHLRGKCSQSQLQLLPVQRVPHPHLLRSKKDCLSTHRILLT